MSPFFRTKSISSSNSCAHVESANCFNLEGLLQLQCTECVSDIVLFIYICKYPEAMRQLLYLGNKKKSLQNKVYSKKEGNTIFRESKAH